MPGWPLVILLSEGLQRKVMEFMRDHEWIEACLMVTFHASACVVRQWPSAGSPHALIRGCYVLWRLGACIHNNALDFEVLKRKVELLLHHHKRL